MSTLRLHIIVRRTGRESEGRAVCQNILLQKLKRTGVGMRYIYLRTHNFKVGTGTYL